MPKHIFHRPANNGDRTIPRMLLPSFHFGDKGDKAWTRRHVCLIYPAAVLKHLYSQTLFWRLLRSPTKEKKKPVFILKTQKQKRKLTKETTKTLKKTLMLAKQARQLRQCSLGGGVWGIQKWRKHVHSEMTISDKGIGEVSGRVVPLPSLVDCCLGKEKYLTSSDKEYNCNDSQIFCNIGQKNCEYFGWLTFSIKPCCALQFTVMWL